MAAVLVLDFDGTVLDTERPAFRAAAEMWEAHGEKLTLELWSGRIGTQTELNPFAELEQRLGRRLDPALQQQRIARKNALTDEMPLNPGIFDWLDDAERLGVRVGIASSSPSSCRTTSPATWISPPPTSSWPRSRT